MSKATLRRRGTRLLVLEDCEDDAALLAIELDSVGLSVELRRVVTEPEFREALEAYVPDVVVSDSDLPGFSGLQALALVRGALPRTSFMSSPETTKPIPTPDRPCGPRTAI